MRDLGTIHWRFIGDEERCRDLVGEARALLGTLRATLGPGVTTGALTRRVGPAAFVRVELFNSMPVVTIEARGEEGGGSTDELFSIIGRPRSRSNIYGWGPPFGTPPGTAGTYSPHHAAFIDKQGAIKRLLRGADYQYANRRTDRKHKGRRCVLSWWSDQTNDMLPPNISYNLNGAIFDARTSFTPTENGIPLRLLVLKDTRYLYGELLKVFFNGTLLKTVSTPWAYHLELAYFIEKAGETYLRYIVTTYEPGGIAKDQLWECLVDFSANSTSGDTLIGELASRSYNTTPNLSLLVTIPISRIPPHNVINKSRYAISEDGRRLAGCQWESFDDTGKVYEWLFDGNFTIGTKTLKYQHEDAHEITVPASQSYVDFTLTSDGAEPGYAFARWTEEVDFTDSESYGFGPSGAYIARSKDYIGVAYNKNTLVAAYFLIEVSKSGHSTIYVEEFGPGERGPPPTLSPPGWAGGWYLKQHTFLENVRVHMKTTDGKTRMLSDSTQTKTYEETLLGGPPPSYEILAQRPMVEYLDIANFDLVYAVCEYSGVTSGALPPLVATRVHANGELLASTNYNLLTGDDRFSASVYREPHSGILFASIVIDSASGDSHTVAYTNGAMRYLKKVGTPSDAFIFPIGPYVT